MAAFANEGAVLVALKYLYPAAVFLYYLASSLLATCTLQALKKTQNARPERPGRKAVVCILGLFLATYVVQLTILGIQSILEKAVPLEHQVINFLSCTLVFGILFIQLRESDTIVWYPFRGSWFIALFFEVVIAVMTVLDSGQAVKTTYNMLHMAVLGLRLVSLLTLTVWTCLGIWTKARPPATDQERQSLLPKPDGNEAGTQGTAGSSGNSPTYGSTAQSDNASDPEFSWERRQREARESMEKRLEEVGNWWEYAKGFAVCIPRIHHPRPYHSISIIHSVLSHAGLRAYS
jgi:hypothetical protein